MIKVQDWIVSNLFYVLIDPSSHMIFANFKMHKLEK